MNVRHFFFYALLLGGVTALAWVVIPTPSVARAVQLPEEPWKLPTPSSYDPKKAFATLTAGGLWGKIAEVAPQLDDDQGWHFVGVVARGQERYVIIKNDKQIERTLALGDALPGGSKIVSINDDRLCILINGKKRSLDIYSQGRLSGKMSTQPAETTVR